MGTYDPKNPYFVQDVDTLCAVCTKLLCADNICSLTSTVSKSSFTKAYEVLQDICEFTFHMDGPQSLCLTCFKNTQFVYEFKELCHTSHSYFVEYSQHQGKLADKANIVIEDTVVKIEIDEFRVDSATAQHHEQLADDATMVTEEIVVKLEMDDSKVNSPTAQSSSADCTESHESVKTMKPVRPSDRNICNKAEELQIEEKSNITEYPLDYLKPVKKSSTYKPFPCRYCSKSFLNSSSRRTHENIHERHYVCSYCDQACGNKSGLKLHERKHTGERPYSCKYCDVAFISNEALQTHTFIHTKEWPWICEECSRPFRHRSAYQRHLQRHKDGSFAPKTAKSLNCPLKTQEEKEKRESLPRVKKVLKVYHEEYDDVD